MKKTGLLIFVIFNVLLMYAQKSKVTLNHIAVYVTDLSKSTVFYQGIIGLDTIPEPFHDGKHTWFKVAEYSHLHLIQGATGPSPLTKNSHICFSVTSMEGMINTLKKAGVVYEDWAGKKGSVTLRVDGIHQIYLKDPDGYWIEINDDYH